MLDAVLGEFNALSPKVSVSNRAVLDAHADTIREVERRIDAVIAPSATCVRPSEPVTPTGPDAFPQLGALQTNLLALALACDLTRVASLQWSRSASPVVHRWSGVTTEHHELSHHTDDEASAREDVTTIHRSYAEQFARLLSKLESTPAGGGTSLLRSERHHLGRRARAGQHALPSLRPIRGGRWRWRNAALGLLDTNGGSHSELLLACAQAAGAPADDLRDPAFCGPDGGRHAMSLECNACSSGRRWRSGWWVPPSSSAT